MSDIVNRLRQDFTTDPIPLHAEAADEIEQLRDAIEDMGRIASRNGPMDMVDALNKIEVLARRTLGANR